MADEVPAWLKAARGESNATPAPQPSSDSSPAWLKAAMGQQATAPTAQDATPAGLSQLDPTSGQSVFEEAPDPFFGSIIHTAGGPDIARIYDKLMKTNLPKELGNSYVGRLSVALGRALPETANFLTSPVGIALIAAHAYPPTRPFAAIADVALGGMQGMNTVASTAQAAKTRSPEDVAQAVKDAAFTGLMIKGFTAGKAKVGAAGISDMSAATPVEERAAASLARLRELKPTTNDTKAQVTAKRKAQVEIINNLKPQSQMERASQTLFDSKFSGLAKIMGMPLPEGVQVGKMILDERNTNMDVERFKTTHLLDQMESEVPESDQSVRKMGYAIQDPGTLQMTPSEIAEKYDMSHKGAEWVQRLRKENVEHWAPYIQDVHGASVGLQSPDTYLHQAWDLDAMADQGILEDPRSRGAYTPNSRRMMRDPGLKKRSFARTDEEGGAMGPGTYKEAIEDLGWIPKYEKVGDIIRARNESMIQAAENTRMANAFRGIGGLVRQDIAAARGIGGWQKASDAPTLFQATYAGQKLRGEGATKGVILDRKPPVAYPDFMHAINAVYADGLKMVNENTGKPTWLGRLEAFRQWGKQIGTITSVFHNWSVMAQTGANKMGNLSLTGNGSSPASLARSVWFTNPDFIRGTRTGIWKVVGKDAKDKTPILRVDPAVALDQIEHGLRLLSPENEEAVVRWMHGFKGTNLGSKMISKFGDIAGGFNKATFDYYLTAEKMDVYNGILAKELSRLGPDATPEQITNIKRQTAQHTNRSFSSESMESLLLHPKTRQALSLFTFAPTWFINNMRQFSAGWENEAQTRMKTRWLAGAGLSFFLATQLANYATTSWFDKDDKGNHTWNGRFTWDNPGLPLVVNGKTYRHIPENIGKVYLGPNPDGSEAYATYGKPLSDGFSWMVDPVRILSGKLNPWVKSIFAEVTGREPGTSFSVIKSEEEGANPRDRLVQRVAIALDPITPFWGENMKRIVERKLAPAVVTPPRGQDSFIKNLTTGPYSAGLPISRGLDISRAQIMYRHAMETKDADLVQAIARVAQANGISMKTVSSIAREQEGIRRKNERGIFPHPAPVHVTAPPPQ